MTGFQKAIKVAAICLGVFIIANIVGAILLGIFIFTGFTNGKDYFDKEDNGKYEVKIDEAITSYDNIKNIELDLKGSVLQITKGEKFDIETKDMNGKITTNRNQTSLKLVETTKNFWNKDEFGKVIITIPDNYNFNKIDIDSGAGTIDIDSLSANYFELDQGAGTVTITNSSFMNTNIDGGAGKIDIRDSSLHNLDLDSGAGRVDIEAFIEGHSFIDCGVGALYLTLNGGEESYKLLTEKGIGSIHINEVEYSNDTTYGNGSNFIEISGGIGSINVNFNKKVHINV